MDDPDNDEDSLYTILKSKKIYEKINVPRHTCSGNYYNDFLNLIGSLFTETKYNFL